MHRFPSSLLVALLLAGTLSGCSDGYGPSAPTNVELRGTWDGTRYAHDFFLTVTNTEFVWVFALADTMSGESSATTTRPAPA